MKKKILYLFMAFIMCLEPINLIAQIGNNEKQIKKIGGCNSNTDGINICKTISPTNIENYFDIYHKLNVTGDKLIVLKTSVAKEYYFPLIKGEKFIPEALIFNRISNKYNFLCRNIIAAHKEYLQGGYSNNYFNLVKRNPKGNMLYFKELYSKEKKLYNIYGYLLFGIYSKTKFSELLKNHPNKIMIIIMYIPVWIISKIRK